MVKSCSQLEQSLERRPVALEDADGWIWWLSVTPTWSMDSQRNDYE